MSELRDVCPFPSGAGQLAGLLDHDPSEPPEPFAALAETRYLELARRAYRGHLPEAATDGSQLLRYAELRAQLGVDDIASRLGDSLPHLSASAERLVLQHFAWGYSSIPSTLPRYEKSHEHDGQHHEHEADQGCNKIHGPLQRFLENTADRVGGKLGGPRAKATVLIGMRALLFCVCPGDDILAIGAQLFSGAAPPSVHTTTQHDELAVLPPRLTLKSSKPKKSARSGALGV